MSQNRKQSYDYLIIGGGIVAGYAADGIRKEDKSGTIGIISNDVDGPYTRPALTKKYGQIVSLQKMTFHLIQQRKQMRM